MKKIFIFLVILFLILTLILIGASFYFSDDSLVRLTPEETNFYFHFNFNHWRIGGKQALKYFNQHWPEDLLKKILVESHFAFKYNLNQETINQIEEMAVFSVSGQPVIVYKYKPNFAGSSLVLGGQKGPRIFYQFLNPRVVVLALNQQTINKIKFQSESNSIFFYRGFAWGFLPFANNLSATIKNEKILLTSEIRDFSWPESFNQKMDYFIHFASFLSDKNYVFSFLNQNNFPLAAIEKILKKRLAYYFPKEITQILPDGSKIIELIADSNDFEFQKEQINGFEINNLKSIGRSPNISFSLDKNYIFLSSASSVLKEYIFQKDLLNQKCFGKTPEEIFYWQANDFGIEDLILASQKKEGRSLIYGCLKLK